jgi:FMN phosphatase YigB (HAD superfamily)
MYLGAARHLELSPHQICMVSAHDGDLWQAARLGFKTVLVRPAGVHTPVKSALKTRAEGGQIDVVVDSFEEIVDMIGSESG